MTIISAGGNRRRGRLQKQLQGQQPGRRGHSVVLLADGQTCRSAVTLTCRPLMNKSTRCFPKRIILLTPYDEFVIKDLWLFSRLLYYLVEWAFPCIYRRPLRMKIKKFCLVPAYWPSWSSWACRCGARCREIAVWTSPADGMKRGIGATEPRQDRLWFPCGRTWKVIDQAVEPAK